MQHRSIDGLEVGHHFGKSNPGLVGDLFEVIQEVSDAVGGQTIVLKQ